MSTWFPVSVRNVRGRNAPGEDSKSKWVQGSQLQLGHIGGKLVTTMAEEYEEGHKPYPVHSPILFENNVPSLIS